MRSRARLHATTQTEAAAEGTEEGGARPGGARSSGRAGGPATAAEATEAAAAPPAATAAAPAAAPAAKAAPLSEKAISEKQCIFEVSPKKKEEQRRQKNTNLQDARVQMYGTHGLHLGAKLKYQIPYEWKHFQTIRSSAPIRKYTIFETFSSVFEVVLNRFPSALDRSHRFLRLFFDVVVVVVVVATLFSPSSSIS